MEKNYKIDDMSVSVVLLLIPTHLLKNEKSIPEEDDEVWEYMTKRLEDGKKWENVSFRTCSLIYKKWEEKRVTRFARDRVSLEAKKIKFPLTLLLTTWHDTVFSVQVIQVYHQGALAVVTYFLEKKVWKKVKTWDEWNEKDVTNEVTLSPFSRLDFVPSFKWLPLFVSLFHFFLIWFVFHISLRWSLLLWCWNRCHSWSVTYLTYLYFSNEMKDMYCSYSLDIFSVYTREETSNVRQQHFES